MIKKSILSVVVATVTFQAAAPAMARNNQQDIIGGIIGGLIGGAIGSQIGNGDGKTAAIIIGAVAGSLIGSSLAGDLQESDQRACRRAQTDVLSSRGTRRSQWQGRDYGSNSGAYGAFETTREGYNNRTGEYCREYRSEIYVNGRSDIQSGVACSRADGSYYEVRTSEVSFDGGRGQGYDQNPYQSNHQDSAPVINDPYIQDPSFNDRTQNGRDSNCRNNDYVDYQDQYGGRQNGGPYRDRNAQRCRRDRGDIQNQNSFQASVIVSSISRRRGGEVVRIRLDSPAALGNIKIQSLGSGLRIREAIAYGQNGERQVLPTLLGSIYEGSTLSSGQVRVRGGIIAIDLRVESMGGFSDLLVKASSLSGYVNLSATRY